MFNEAVLDHFRNPRNAGDLPDPTAVVEVTNPVCGDVLKLSARVEAGSIAAASFKAQGCVAAIASSSALTEIMIGKSPQQLSRITANDISQTLGGLPPTTFHAAQLCIDALAALINKL